MKLLFGIVIGVGLVLGGTVFAETVDLHGMVKVGEIDGWEKLSKYYDYDNGVVCYSNKTGYSGGISCLKN